MQHIFGAMEIIPIFFRGYPTFNQEGIKAKSLLSSYVPLLCYLDRNLVKDDFEFIGLKLDFYTNLNTR